MSANAIKFHIKLAYPGLPGALVKERRTTVSCPRDVGQVNWAATLLRRWRQRETPPWRRT